MEAIKGLGPRRPHACREDRRPDSRDSSAPARSASPTSTTRALSVTATTMVLSLLTSVSRGVPEVGDGESPLHMKSGE